MCNERNIQELLPAYLQEALTGPDRERVAGHLAECADCKGELELLRALTEEAVPDPGEAFWAALPERVYREVRTAQASSSSKGSFLHGLGELFRFRPWAWTTALVAIAAVAVLFALRSPVVDRDGKALPELNEQYADALTQDQISLAGLSAAELSSLDTLAAGELSELRDGVSELFLNAPDGAIDDRLSEMDSQELESLSRKLDAAQKEART